MSKTGCLSLILDLFLNVSRRYDMMTPEQRSRTKYFGGYSIIMSILCSGLFVLILWGILALFGMLDSVGIGIFLLVPFLIILGAAELVLLGELIVGGLFGILYQARCNKSSILWIAIVVFIIIVAAMVFGLLLMFDVVGIEL